VKTPVSASIRQHGLHGIVNGIEWAYEVPPAPHVLNGFKQIIIRCAAPHSKRQAVVFYCGGKEHPDSGGSVQAQATEKRVCGAFGVVINANLNCGHSNLLDSLGKIFLTNHIHCNTNHYVCRYFV
jgi:hypothetical protein